MTSLTLVGQEFSEPTPNIERVDFDNYRTTFAKNLEGSEKRGKEDVKLALFELVGLPARYEESWLVSTDGTTYEVNYRDKTSKGGASVHVRTLPFKTMLGMAPSEPNVKKEGEAMSVWFGQQWDVLHIPFLKGQVRCFVDQAATAEKSEIHSTEPFEIKLGENKVAWIWITAEYGSEGMTLEQALRAFKMTKK